MHKNACSRVAYVRYEILSSSAKLRSIFTACTLFGSVTTGGMWITANNSDSYQFLYLLFKTQRLGDCILWNLLSWAQ
jgi:hypothetical protein